VAGDIAVVGIDGPLDFGAGYTLTPGEQMRPETICAEWDGTAAAGSFKPSVAIRTAAGLLVARVFPGEDFAAGDDGVVTYAPFLREQAGAAPAGASLPWARLRKTASGNQTFATATGQMVSWDTFQQSDAGTYTQIGNFLRPLVDGVFALTVRLFWTSVTSYDHAQIFFSGIDADGFANWSFPAQGDTYNSVTTVTTVCRLAAGASVAAYVHQSSGVDWTLDGSAGSFWEAVRLGPATMTDRDG
jgi:hypothetical protein